MSLVAIVVAGALALDPLFIHGFAPTCSDGYAEANGTSRCAPEWDDAAPYLVALTIALIGSAGAAMLLRRGRRPRQAYSKTVY